GCGGGGDRTAPVSGRITLDGQPKAGMIVSFSPLKPASGKASNSATGTTDENGNYSLRVFEGKTVRDGAFVGENEVIINLSERDIGIAPKGREVRDLIPAKYNTKTELKFPVPSGGTRDANFELKSK